MLPFRRFRRSDGSGVDSLLGPEMKSTGEVMGIADSFGAAFAKADRVVKLQIVNQRDEVVQYADFLGDSYKLSQRGAGTCNSWW